MKFNSVLLGAATAAVTLATAGIAASPAQAISVALGSQINFTGQGLNRSATLLDFVGPFSSGQSISVQSATGSFTDPSPLDPFNNTPPQVNVIASNLAPTAISDLALSGGNYTGAIVNNFIRRIRSDQNIFTPNVDISFDLISLSVVTNTTEDFLARLTGRFRIGSTVISEGIGTLTAQTNGSSYSLTLTAVPTPALVPAAVGFGMAMLRKRKGEQAEAEQETAEVKA